MWFLSYILTSAIICNIVFWGYCAKINYEFNKKYTYKKISSPVKRTVINILGCAVPLCIPVINILLIMLMSLVNEDDITTALVNNLNAKLK